MSFISQALGQESEKEEVRRILVLRLGICDNGRMATINCPVRQIRTTILVTGFTDSNSLLKLHPPTSNTTILQVTEVKKRSNLYVFIVMVIKMCKDASEVGTLSEAMALMNVVI
jgi:hypothetical protein